MPRINTMNNINQEILIYVCGKNDKFLVFPAIFLYTQPEDMAHIAAPP
jgi:hypothetical protein